MDNFIEPKCGLEKFTCPHCKKQSNQEWNMRLLPPFDGMARVMEDLDLKKNPVWYAKCQKCEEYSIWYKGKIIFPKSKLNFIPNEDLDNNIKKDYNEALNIFNDSPRGAAALLRLSLQKLCKQLGEKGININDDIKSLVAKGLPEWVQQALDTVRVVGNNAVHPGLIDCDDEDTVKTLFELINSIAVNLLTNPRKSKEAFDKLPESIINSITKRDK